jgi:hypothetical protein
MVKLSVCEPARAPEAIRRSFGGAGKPLAIVLREGVLLAIHYDNSRHDWRATPEVAALRDACTFQKKHGYDQPWNLAGAVLYTSLSSGGVGPLARAECQLAGVTQIVSVPHLPIASNDIRETPCLRNSAFMKLVAGAGYNGAESVKGLAVVHDPAFANRAQKEWKRKTKAARPHDPNLKTVRRLYTGISLKKLDK